MSSLITLHKSIDFHISFTDVLYDRIVCGRLWG